MNPNNLNTIDELITYKGPEWQASIINAREVMPEKLLNDQALINLAIHSRQTFELDLLIKCFFQDSKIRPVGIPAIDYLMKVVDASVYPLEDWIAVIYFFNQWLENENRSAPFLKQLGYLQCCEDSPEIKLIHIPLINLVTDMLSQHGFVG